MSTWKRYAAGLIAVAAFAVPGAASADHGCNGTVTEVGPLYVDDRGPDQAWVYAESNETPGLQSGGEGPLGYTDPCNHPNPDTLVY